MTQLDKFVPHYITIYFNYHDVNLVQLWSAILKVKSTYQTSKTILQWSVLHVHCYDAVMRTVGRVTNQGQDVVMSKSAKNSSKNTFIWQKRLNCNKDCRRDLLDAESFKTLRDQIAWSFKIAKQFKFLQKNEFIQEKSFQVTSQNFW